MKIGAAKDIDVHGSNLAEEKVELQEQIFCENFRDVKNVT